jgi:hypothetical protein
LRENWNVGAADGGPISSGLVLVRVISRIVMSGT